MPQRAVALAVLTLCAAVVVLAGPVLAHIELDRSEPAAGAVLNAAPSEVFLRFTQAVEEESFTIRVRAPNGGDVTMGETQSGGRAAAVDLARLTDEGLYRVRYRGVAADGHPVEGRLRFRLRFPEVDPATADPQPTAQATTPPATTAPTAPPATPPAAATAQRRAVPWWPFAVLLGIAALVGVTLFRRR